MFGSKENPNRLSPPDIAKRKDALEVLRVSAIEGERQEFSVKPTWSDPGAWGLLLV
jgi:hypothetical protein